ncbi:hypothetical protein GH714_018961 [Hevea brasiliensis]|uniref:SBP-type domain-containing protein n=1 Tax=Hevea brasiliensis TaxID=3981 RepID=A0A6A6LV78_HEVBR|nr:hypothetical protein GH714_018961 [Hevea brasiliensis]
MENDGNLYTAHSNRSRGQNSANANLVWDMWEPNSSRFDWGNSSNGTTFFTASVAAATTFCGDTICSTHPDPTSAHALMFQHQGLYHPLDHQYQQLSLYGGEGSHLHPDPHLMCLKLGKRHYFEDTIPVVDRQVGFSIGKRGKPYYSVVGGHTGQSSSAHGGVGSAANVPRCQVEGCQVVLVNAKDYHRRHKVCEMHSKAPKVIVLGLEQRFCQQCSSAALRELIAENRAAILARQLVHERHLQHNAMEDLGDHSEPSPNNSFIPHHHQVLAEAHNWDRFHDTGTQLTLDLMQAPTSAFGFLSTRGKNNKEEEEECSELWNTWAGAHVV